MNFHCVFLSYNPEMQNYIRCLMFWKEIFIINPSCKIQNVLFLCFLCFHFQLKLLLLIDFCALQVSFHAIYFISEFTFFIQSIIE